MKITNLIKEKIQYSYPLNPVFGSAHLKAILRCTVTKNQSLPEEAFFDLPESLNVLPFSSSLHYGQTIFEGMKVFRQKDGSVGIFRPDLHAKRFVRSAKIMNMAPITEEFFLDCLYAFVDQYKEFVPNEENHSLYLRPLMIANDNVIKVKSSEKYEFMIMACVVGNYFTKGGVGQKVVVNKDFVRAFPNGTGEAKTAANYALSLASIDYAYSKGYEQVLYLDSKKNKYIEELGGMNFFICKNNELLTPKLTGTILHGVTRKSIIEIATFLGHKVSEVDISIDELLSDNKAGIVNEIFATGTAASISYLSQIGVVDSETQDIDVYEFNEISIGQKLLKYLMDTQVGLTEHSTNWIIKF